MTIGVVADSAGVPANTIRFYEELGLLPAAPRRANGYRAYSEADVRALKFIKRARSVGIPVDEVRAMLDLWINAGRPSAAVKVLAIKHLAALDRKITEAASLRRALADLVERCQSGDRPGCPMLDDVTDRASR